MQRKLLVLALLPHLAQAEQATQEDWNAKFQTTYIWQKKPSFKAAYSGPNSLLASKEKSYTFTTDAFFGICLR
jgi:high affinity Mn2+ porin